MLLHCPLGQALTWKLPAALRHTVSAENHARVMSLLQESGGRLDSTLDGLLTVLASARQPRFHCTKEQVGSYLLVTVRPRQADLLGDDVRPMVGISRQPVAPGRGTPTDRAVGGSPTLLTGARGAMTSPPAAPLVMASPGVPATPSPAPASSKPVSSDLQQLRETLVALQAAQRGGTPPREAPLRVDEEAKGAEPARSRSVAGALVMAEAERASALKRLQAEETTASASTSRRERAELDAAWAALGEKEEALQRRADATTATVDATQTAHEAALARAAAQAAGAREETERVRAEALLRERELQRSAAAAAAAAEAAQAAALARATAQVAAAREEAERARTAAAQAYAEAERARASVMAAAESSRPPASAREVAASESAELTRLRREAELARKPVQAPPSSVSWRAVVFAFIAGVVLATLLGLAFAQRAGVSVLPTMPVVAVPPPPPPDASPAAANTLAALALARSRALARDAASAVAERSWAAGSQRMPNESREMESPRAAAPASPPPVVVSPPPPRPRQAATVVPPALPSSTSVDGAAAQALSHLPAILLFCSLLLLALLVLRLLACSLRRAFASAPREEAAHTASPGLVSPHRVWLRDDGAVEADPELLAMSAMKSPSARRRNSSANRT